MYLLKLIKICPFIKQTKMIKFSHSHSTKDNPRKRETAILFRTHPAGLALSSLKILPRTHSNCDNNSRLRRTSRRRGLCMVRFPYSECESPPLDSPHLVGAGVLIDTRSEAFFLLLIFITRVSCTRVHGGIKICLSEV